MTFNKYYIVVRNKKWIAIYVTFEIPNLKTVYLKTHFVLFKGLLRCFKRWDKDIWEHICWCWYYNFVSRGKYIPTTIWHSCTLQSQFILSNLCVLQMLMKFDKYYFQLLAVLFAFVICCQTGDKNHAM